MNSYDGAPIYSPILIGDPARPARGYIRLDVGEFRCAWQGCGHRIVHESPATVTADEILKHARTHGVDA